MKTPLIRITRYGDRSGYVVAIMPPSDSAPGERLLVGDVYRDSRDGEPENWRAWLWPVAGGAMHDTQTCVAVDAAAPEKLRDKLQKRGPWWGGEA